MVAGLDLVVDRAVEGRDGLVEEHGAVLGDRERQPVEALLARPGELAADVVVVVGEHADAEVPGLAQERPVELVVAIENDTSGGSMLTEVKDDAAMPVSWPFTDAATATTPDGEGPEGVAQGALVERGEVGWAVMRTPPGGRLRSGGRAAGRAAASQAAYAAGSSCCASRT